MRLTLVTETFAPQVNGVSRTLGQLVDHLERSGDSVQVVHPDYGKPAAGVDHHLVKAWPLPFYREVSVPLPPFGKAHRAIEAFRPDVIHVATEITLGLSALRLARRVGVPVVSSFHTNFDQYCDHYRLGWAKGAAWRYLRWFHNRTLETYVPSRATIADLEGRGFERLVLWPRGVDGTLFRPDRPGREAVRRALGLEPRRRGDRPRQPARGREERDAPGLGPEGGRRGQARRPVPVRRRRPRPRRAGTGDGAERPVRRLSGGRSPGRPLRGEPTSSPSPA